MITDLAYFSGAVLSVDTRKPSEAVTVTELCKSVPPKLMVAGPFSPSEPRTVVLPQFALIAVWVICASTHVGSTGASHDGLLLYVVTCTFPPLTEVLVKVEGYLIVSPSFSFSFNLYAAKRGEPSL